MVVSIATDGPLAIVTIDNPPVNAASQAVRQGLLNAVHATAQDETIGAVVLICAGRTFVAGADLREFGAPPVPPLLVDVAAAIEGTTKPWIAALHGTALGGGLEIAMACHYRIADAGARLGLPEVALGLIPGAGGTVRLPRLAGPAKALEMIATGKPITAQNAHHCGLIDRIAQTGLRDEAVEFAHEVAQRPLPPASLARKLPDYDPAQISARIAAIKARAGGQNSPRAACEAIENALSLTAPQALAGERALFMRLKDDPQSIALRHIFFAERAAGHIPGLKGIAAPLIQRIGIVGGGTMGAGIAAACLLAGFSVTMIERDPSARDKGHARVRETLNASQKRGLVSAPQVKTMLGAFNAGTDYAALSPADLVIEAVFEDMAIKQAVFAALDKATRPGAILASNTSYLDIGEIARSVRDPSRVIGLHFFSPAHIMKLLELVIPPQASPSTIAGGVALGKRLGKVTVPSGICDGFIGNRIMSAYRTACDEMLEDGALPDQVDRAMRDFGFPMGIYEMQDLAGLDIAWAMRKRRALTRDPALRYVDIADTLCEAGRFGRKTGRGWYLYDGNTPRTDPEVETLILVASRRKGIARRAFATEDIITRILSVMQAEGQAILSEGIAAKVGDIDVVMVNGYGFPRWRGGPMFLHQHSGAGPAAGQHSPASPDCP